MLHELNDVYTIIFIVVLCLWALIVIFKERFQKYLCNWIVAIVMVGAILIYILQLYDVFVNSIGNYIDAFFPILGIVISVRVLLKLPSRKF